MKRGAALVLAAALLIGAADPDPQAEAEHRVKAGETLAGIAQRAEVPRVLIIEANGLKAPYTLRTGQMLIIPRRRSHTVKPGETGFGIALEYGLPWKTIAEANGLDPKKPVRAGQKLALPTLSSAAATPTPDPAPAKAAAMPKGPRLALPVEGKQRRSFTARPSRSYHDGLDIVAGPGTAVRAAAAGTVLYAGDEPKRFGKLVVIDHGQGWTSAYGFLDKVTVKAGRKIKAGERLGKVGQTGLATRDELHFELRRDNRPVDPGPYLAQGDGE